MEQALVDLSSALAGAVDQAAQYVVAVEGRERRGSSGIHWRPGVILTAEHTLRREEGITVRLPDGRTVPATLAGRDAGTDVAVLRADCADVPVAELREEPVRPGQIALAVGRDSGAGPAASMGVISAVSGAWRTWRGGLLDSYIRLDLTLYPGVSGGAVVDTAGRVVGIATGALSRIAGIAIPVGTAARVAGELLSKGRVARGYFGVGLQPVELPQHLREKLKLAQPEGLIVLTVEPGGPADKAGVLIGDILIALDGRHTADTDEVQAALGGDAIGRAVAASIIRGGELAELSISVGERPRRGA